MIFYSENNHHTVTNRGGISSEDENVRQILTWLNTESESWSMESPTEIQNIFMAAVRAREKDLPIHLLILVLRDKEYTKKKRHVYICDLVRIKAEKINASDDTEINAALDRYEVLRNTLIARNLSKEYAAESGRTLFQKLIPEEIRKRLESELEKSHNIKWGVWIYSNDDDFNPLWEWLYTPSEMSSNTEISDATSHKTKNENSSPLRKITIFFRFWRKGNKIQQPQENEKEDGFFWGDRFYIIRVPKPPNFQDLNSINNVALLFNKGGCAYAYDDKKCIHKPCEVKPKEIELADYNALKGLNNFDCIHVAADITDLKKKTRDVVRNALSFKRNNSGNDKKAHSFLFLNICKCDTSSKIQLELRELTSAITWIDTSLPVTKKFAPIFAEEFYKKFCRTGKNVAEAATKTREEIKKRGELDDCDRFLRLAYIVNGNPFTKWR